jgi:DEAD/DEAH box helicase domain-containing protein
LIPSVLAQQLRETVLDYLGTTFALADRELDAALFAFLSGDNGLFRGPFVELQLPYRLADADPRAFLDYAPSFRPYAHQIRAFERLSSRGGRTPAPTLVTTGTGSGKTECFLFPILDHCVRHQQEPGIKAILLYPMNALATDQARRLAKILYSDPRLRGVTAGLYIGGEGSHGSSGRDYLCDVRRVLRESPPDILLTNYKMLDFLLLRPDDRTLWRWNKPDTLRYLVLDELHTYDGAQGSDVACLIRRLRARLDAHAGSITFVGTSATLGGDEGDAPDAGRRRLAEFASDLAGEPVGPDAVITEDRYATAEALADVVDLTALPSPDDRARLDPSCFASPAAWLSAQRALWLGDERLDAVETGLALRRHAFLRSLLRALDGRVRSWRELSTALARVEPALADLDDPTRWLLVQSFLGLVSDARSQDGERLRPFLALRVQVWVRELRRLLRAVRPDTEAPERRFDFAWHDQLATHPEEPWLPIARCWACGVSGWAGVQPEGNETLLADVAAIGRAWLQQLSTARFVTPQTPREGLFADAYLCPRCLRLHVDAACPCGGLAFPVAVSRELSTRAPRRWLERCPCCHTDGALSLLGARAPSLGSVLITHLFLSPYNHDRKLLAFTDAVQDASHHAGFFGARTWRFSVRAAMQTVLAEGDSPTLEEVVRRLLARAEAEAPTLRARIAAWLPTDLADLPEALRHRDKPDDPAVQAALWSRIASRLSWEVAQEYGLGARSLGRTLERTGCSSAHPDETLLRVAVTALTEDIRAQLLIGPHSPEVDEAAVAHLLDAVLDRLRVRGGIFHPLLDRYVETGKDYLLSKRQQPLLSPFARGVRSPVFLQGPVRIEEFDSFAPIGNAEQSWYRDLARRVFGVPAAHLDVLRLYEHAMKRLVAQGILAQRTTDKAPVWGFPMDGLRVTPEVAISRCPTCKETTPMAAAVARRMEGHPCLRLRCEGRLEVVSLPASRYYADVYRQGTLRRVVPAEHTGLLDRKTRERIETRFKEGTEPGAPNVLVCTPTLEMGIDIGDLSAVMTCAMPPAPANHIQRVGRAGRQTGNALALGLALGRAHDQYFFEDPMEMIAGAVDPPGMFLDAPEVLRRQLVAFVMDRWSRLPVTIASLPAHASEVLGAARERVLGDLMRFEAAHRATLIEDFIALFAQPLGGGKPLQPKNIEWLRSLAVGDALTEGVLLAFQDLENEIKELVNLRDRLRGYLDGLAAKPVESDERAQERQETEAAIAAVGAALLDLRKKYPLEVLTDAGVLPNYAFPERGVILRATIEQDRDPGGRPKDGATTRRKKRWEVKEYLRPAANALREFAPFNTFYAEGRHLPVTDVDLGTETKPLVRPFRFCPLCDHSALDGTEPPPEACPRCGAPGWGDAGQRHDLVTFRLARSFTRQHVSLTNDSSDERDEKRYRVADLIDVQRENWGGARASTSPLFGVEFLRDLTLREINFGPDGERDDRMTVANRDVSAKGFRVCPECGRVQSGDGAKPDHAIQCARRRGTSPKQDFRAVWLTREMTSEAIRLLLPAATVGVDEARVSFRAALLLGLRKKFRGRPIHLVVKASSEPVAGRGAARRTFLVLYDAVPGGTGYLRELWHTDGVRECMDLALRVLERCGCRLDPNRDGCYRCLLAHDTSFESVRPSRRRAVELLREGLLAWPAMKVVDTLSEVSVDTLLESELERRFVNALHQHVADVGGAWRPALHRGKAECARFTLGEVTWLLEPQVDVEVETGTARKCRPDFVLWSQRDDVDDVAIFCDGYEFHAQPEAPVARIGDDLDKRASLLASGRWRVWSVTWSDLDHFTGVSAEPVPALFDAVSETTLSALAARLGSRLSKDHHRVDAMRTLVTWLRHPDEAAWRAHARALLLAAVQGAGRVSAGQADAAEDALWTFDTRAELPAMTPAAEGDTLAFARSAGHVSALGRVSLDAVRAQRWDDLRAVIRLFDEAPARAREDFRVSWRAVLVAWNVLQFHGPVAVISSEQDRAAQRAERLRDGAPAVGADQRWDTVFELVDASCETLARALCAARVDCPVVGEDIMRGSRVVATGELVWNDARVVVTLEGAPLEGWTVFAPTATSDDVVAALARA